MVEGEGSLKPVKFRIPFIPPSMNDIYYHIKDHYANYTYILKPEVRLWKTKAKEYVPVFEVPVNQPIYINWTAVRSWRYQSGAAKRFDITNLQKVLMDAISEKIGVDDCLIWDSRCTKQHSEKDEFVEVEMGVYKTGVLNAEINRTG